MSFVETLDILTNGDLDPLHLGSKVQSGFGSRGMFARQKAASGISAYDNPTKELSEFYKQTYEGISWGVVQNAPPIVANRIRADRSPVPNTRGRVDVSGGISLQVNTRSMLPFIKHATMTAGKGSAGVATDGGPGYNVTEEFLELSVLTAQAMTAGTPTGVYTYTKPANTTKLLYSAAAVTAMGGSGNGFGEQNSTPPSQLDITVNNVTTYTNATITITALDQNGIVLEEHYPINDGAVTGSPNSTDDIPNAYGQVAAHKIRTRYNYLDIVSIKLTGITQGTPTLDVDAFSANVVGSGGQGRIPPMKNTRRSCFEIVKAIQDPMTIYLVKGGNPHESNQEGGIPNVYAGCYINSFTLNVAETIMFDMDFIGRNGYTRVTPGTIDEWGNEWGRAVVPPDAPSGAAGGGIYTDAWNFAAPINPVMTGWESGLQIKELGQDEWVTVPCSDFNFNLNNQLTHNERYWFRRWHTEPTPSAALDAMVNGTVDYRTAQGYDFLQVQNLPVEARMICFSRDVGAKESYIIAHIGEAVLNETVDPAVSGEDVITQSFTLKCLSKGERAFGTRSYADTLETYQERSPIVFEVASDQVLYDIAA